MKKFLKGLLQVLFLVAVGFITTTATIHSVIKSHEIPEQKQISDVANINNFLNIRQKKSILRSRETAVKVVSISTEMGGMSTSSGTYVKFDNKYYVLTVAHGLIGGCSGTAIMTDEMLYKCERLVDLNNLVDYGIIEIEEIAGKNPVQIPTDLPKGQQWTKNFSIMNRAYYTGFPNAIGPLTIEAKVSGYNENDFLYLQSFGWSGSSGAGIFSESGKLMAYVLALTVGQTGYGYNVSEDIVIAVPLFKVNWENVLRANKENKNEKERSSVESELSNDADADSGFGYSDR